MKKAVLFFLIVVCFSCNKNEVRDLQGIPIEEYHVFNTKESQPLSKLEYTIDKVVELKMIDNYDIAECEKFVIQDGRCYILDGVNRKIFVFNEDGEMLNALGRIGHAADEILRKPSDFSVDEETKDIYLFERDSQKIIKYDSLGNVVSVARLESDNIWSYAMGRTRKGYFVYPSRYSWFLINENTELSIYDSQQNRITGFFEMEQTFRHIANNIPFGVYYDKITFTPNYSNTVYYLDNDSIIGGVKITFDYPYYPAEILDKYKYSDEEITIEDNHILDIDYYFENEYWRRVDYNNIRIGRYLENKKTGRIYTKVNNFLGFSPFFYFTIVEDKIAYLITTDDLELRKEKKTNLSDEEWNTLYDSSCEPVQKLLDGELKTPCLIFMTLP